MVSNYVAEPLRTSIAMLAEQYSSHGAALPGGIAGEQDMEVAMSSVVVVPDAPESSCKLDRESFVGDTLNTKGSSPTRKRFAVQVNMNGVAGSQKLMKVMANAMEDGLVFTRASRSPNCKVALTL